MFTPTKSLSRPQRGVSLIELIVFIVIISVSLTGILLVMNLTTRNSADPLVHKQALAIAESLLEEVELMPFTYCDPDDASAVTATGPFVGGTRCNATVEGLGAETIGGVTETRGGIPPFDNVNDYNDFVPGPVADFNGIAAPAGYIARIAVAETALAGIPATESLFITVTVDNPVCEMHPCITLDGYRTRYAPNSMP